MCATFFSDHQTNPICLLHDQTYTHQLFWWLKRVRKMNTITKTTRKHGLKHCYTSANKSMVCYF